jgi:hypothetical protein
MLKTKCAKALDISKLVSKTGWGADKKKKIFLQLYRYLVRSKLDYGCIVYGSARKAYLQALDAIHNRGIRMCLGAFKESLYVEANEPSLKNRGIKLSLLYIIKLRSNTKHPTYNCIFNPKFEIKYHEKTIVIKPLVLRLQNILKILT